MDTNTRLVLANAMYFKGQWATPFDAKRTKPGPFTNANGTKNTVPFMTQDDLKVETSESNEAIILALPYFGNELQMVIVLPGKAVDLSTLEENMNIETWDTWMKGFHKSFGLTLTLPKFKLETEYKLNETLSKQGMPDAFIGGVADFSAMTLQNRLYISHVAHKAFVEVNEEGTEAAAATAVTARFASGGSTITIDRPFLFAIRHRGTGAILFLGRVEKL